ncbi:MAG: hypothetical protein ACFFE8_15470, partial [Candidatus Heimdallarchaeota archaeon]
SSRLVCYSVLIVIIILNKISFQGCQNTYKGLKKEFNYHTGKREHESVPNAAKSRVVYIANYLS